MCAEDRHCLRNIGIITTLESDRQNMHNHGKNNLSIHHLQDENTACSEVSKTQIKQAMLALQSLGERLITLKKTELEALALPEKLFDAILEAKKITHWSAIKRQKQYIGRLMRDVDTKPIQTYLDAIHGVSQEHNAWLHRLEKLRESLLTTDQALQALLSQYPHVNVQALRTLIRNVHKEKMENKPPKHFRALFQMLKALIPEPCNIQSENEL